MKLYIIFYLQLEAPFYFCNCGSKRLVKKSIHQCLIETDKEICKDLHIADDRYDTANCIRS